jgi:hypothetical protein
MHILEIKSPEPRLITLPERRVCGCGRILTRHERAQECCSVCAAFHVLPLIPFAPGVA